MNDENEVVRLTRAVDESDHALGPQSAPATLVEYGDYECPYCRQLHPIILEIMRRTVGLGYVYRHFPISKLHPHAERAAQAAEAAGAQGRFWEMHNALFAQDQPLDDKRLALCAGQAGLDIERYTREMTEGVYSERVDADFKSALYGDGVTGTPTLYLNGVRLSNIHGLEELLTAVTGAGATVQADSEEHANWLSRLRKFRMGRTHLHLL